MESTVAETDLLADFVRQLWEAGQVGVLDAFAREFSSKLRDDAWLQLQLYASEERPALAGSPPSVSRPSAEWALLQMYRACSFLVHRTHAAEDMHAALGRELPEAASPDVCYSIDLTFRFLPDLHRLAKSVSASDPLVAVLETWGRQWPLSSVGMIFRPSEDTNASIAREPAPGNFDLTGWWADACLRSVYVDRVILQEDVSRLNDPAVADAVRAAIGLHPEVSPKIAAALDERSERSLRERLNEFEIPQRLSTGTP